MTRKRIRPVQESMATVLAETVAELSNRIECRRSLAFAGFSDEEITEHLASARIRARHLLAAEADRRVREEFKK